MKRRFTSLAILQSCKLEQCDRDSYRHGVHLRSLVGLENFIDLVGIIDAERLPSHSQIDVGAEFLLVIEILVLVIQGRPFHAIIIRSFVAVRKSSHQPYVNTDTQFEAAPVAVTDFKWDVHVHISHLTALILNTFWQKIILGNILAPIVTEEAVGILRVISETKTEPESDGFGLRQFEIPHGRDVETRVEFHKFAL